MIATTCEIYNNDINLHTFYDNEQRGLIKTTEDYTDKTSYYYKPIRKCGHKDESAIVYLIDSIYEELC